MPRQLVDYLAIFGTDIEALKLEIENLSLQSPQLLDAKCAIGLAGISSTSAASNAAPTEKASTTARLRAVLLGGGNGAQKGAAAISGDQPSSRASAFNLSIALLERFPSADSDDAPLSPMLQSLPDFCFPAGAYLHCEKPRGISPAYYCFALTTGKGVTLHVACLLVHERHTFGVETVYVPKAFCMISKLPHIHTFKALLTDLVLASGDRDGAGLAQEFVAQLFFEVPVPPDHLTQVVFSVGSRSVSLLDQTFCRDFTFRPLLSCLSGPRLVQLLMLMILERKIVLWTKKLSLVVLSMACEIARALIFPFQWQHVYIPVLPVKLHDLLHCPAPFLMGVQGGLEIDSIPDDVAIFDLDSDRTIPAAPDLPPEPAPMRELRKLIKFYRWEQLEANRKYWSSFHVVHFSCNIAAAKRLAPSEVPIVSANPGQEKPSSNKLEVPPEAVTDSRTTVPSSSPPADPGEQPANGELAQHDGAGEEDPQANGNDITAHLQQQDASSDLKVDEKHEDSKLEEFQDAPSIVRSVSRLSKARAEAEMEEPEAEAVTLESEAKGPVEISGSVQQSPVDGGDGVQAVVEQKESGAVAPSWRPSRPVGHRRNPSLTSMASLTSAGSGESDDPVSPAADENGAPGAPAPGPQWTEERELDFRQKVCATFLEVFVLMFHSYPQFVRRRKTGSANLGGAATQKVDVVNGVSANSFDSAAFLDHIRQTTDPQVADGLVETLKGILQTNAWEHFVSLPSDHPRVQLFRRAVDLYRSWSREPSHARQRFQDDLKAWVVKIYEPEHTIVAPARGGRRPEFRVKKRSRFSRLPQLGLADVVTQTTLVAPLPPSLCVSPLSWREDLRMPIDGAGEVFANAMEMALMAGPRGDKCIKAHEPLFVRLLKQLAAPVGFQVYPRVENTCLDIGAANAQPAMADELTYSRHPSIVADDLSVEDLLGIETRAANSNEQTRLRLSCVIPGIRDVCSPCSSCGWLIPFWELLRSSLNAPRAVPDDDEGGCVAECLICGNMWQPQMSLARGRASKPRRTSSTLTVNTDEAFPMSATSGRSLTRMPFLGVEECVRRIRGEQLEGKTRSELRECAPEVYWCLHVFFGLRVELFGNSGVGHGWRRLGSTGFESLCMEYVRFEDANTNSTESAATASDVSVEYKLGRIASDIGASRSGDRSPSVCKQSPSNFAGESPSVCKFENGVGAPDGRERSKGSNVGASDGHEQPDVPFPAVGSLPSSPGRVLRDPRHCSDALALAAANLASAAASLGHLEHEGDGTGVLNPYFQDAISAVAAAAAAAGRASLPYALSPRQPFSSGDTPLAFTADMATPIRCQAAGSPNFAEFSPLASDDPASPSGASPHPASDIFIQQFAAGVNDSAMASPLEANETPDRRTPAHGAAASADERWIGEFMSHASPRRCQALTAATCGEPKLAPAIAVVHVDMEVPFRNDAVRGLVAPTSAVAVQRKRTRNGAGSQGPRQITISLQRDTCGTRRCATSPLDPRHGALRSRVTNAPASSAKGAVRVQQRSEHAVCSRPREPSRVSRRLRFTSPQRHMSRTGTQSQDCRSEPTGHCYVTAFHEHGLRQEHSTKAPQNRPTQRVSSLIQDIQHDCDVVHDAQPSSGQVQDGPKLPGATRTDNSIEEGDWERMPAHVEGSTAEEKLEMEIGRLTDEIMELQHRSSHVDFKQMKGYGTSRASSAALPSSAHPIGPNDRGDFARMVAPVSVGFQPPEISQQASSVRSPLECNRVCVPDSLIDFAASAATFGERVEDADTDRSREDVVDRAATMDRPAHRVHAKHRWTRRFRTAESA